MISNFIHPYNCLEFYLGLIHSKGFYTIINPISHGGWQVGLRILQSKFIFKYLWCLLFDLIYMYGNASFSYTACTAPCSTTQTCSGTSRTRPQPESIPIICQNDKLFSPHLCFVPSPAAEKVTAITTFALRVTSPSRCSDNSRLKLS